jgi:hypothetical protein
MIAQSPGTGALGLKSQYDRPKNEAIQKTSYPALLSFVITAIVLLIWVTRYGPTWPYVDSLRYLDYLSRLTSGEMEPWRILFARDNEHLIAFHVSFALISLTLFDLRTKALLFENAALLLLAGWTLWMVLRGARIAAEFPIAVPVVIAISLLNPSQTALKSFECYSLGRVGLILSTAPVNNCMGNVSIRCAC